MKKLRVRLFGKLSICYGSEPLPGLESSKVQELFCYLLLHQRHPLPRTTLSSILWGDICTTSNARKYLRNALWRLRSAIGSKQGLVDMLVADDEWIEWKPSDGLWLDVAEFEDAYRVCRHVEASELEPYIPSIETAAQLYTGDLLANWNHDWCLTARDRLYQHYLVMLDRLAEFYELRAAYNDVYRYTEELLQLDPAHERTHRRLMRVYLKIGDRTRALRQFDRCAEVLKQELGVGPGTKTLAVLEQICKERQGASVRTRKSAVGADGRTRPASTV